MRGGSLDSVLSYLRGTAGGVEGDLSDGELLDRFLQAGEEAAFAVLVQRHGPMVLGVCRRVLGNAHDAEDAFQATFLVLARNVGSIQKRPCLAGWLHGVASRVSMRARSQAMRRRRREGLAGSRAPTEGIDEVSWQELRAVLDEEIVELSEAHRAPLVLCYLEGKTNEQAARELGWPKSSLSTRLARAREILRDRLARRGITLSLTVLTAALADRAASAAVPALLLLGAVRAARHGGAAAVPKQVLALADGAMKSLLGQKLALLGFVLAMGIALAGAGVVSRTPADKSASADKPAAAAQSPRLDRAGDPLPAGALARLGTVRFRPGGAAVSALAFSPDGKLVASGGYNGPLTLTETATGKEVRRFGDPQMRITSLAFSADGKAIASGTYQGLTTLWDARTGEAIRHFEGVQGAVVRFSPDGKLLATCYTLNALGRMAPEVSATIHLSDVRTGKRRRTLHGHKAEVYSLAFSPDGKTLASVSSDKTLRLWATATGECRRAFPPGPAPLISVAYAPDGKTLATGGRDGTVRIWGAESGKEVRHFAACRLGVFSLVYSRNGACLATVGQDEPVRLWSTATGKEARRMHTQGSGMLLPLAFSPDGKRLAFGGDVLQLWEAATGKDVCPFDGSGGPILASAFSPDGRTIATAGNDPVIRLWDAATGRELRQLPGHEYAVVALAFSGDGKTLVSKSRDRTVRTWEVATGKEVGRVTPAEPWLGVVALSPGGKILAADCRDKSIRLWDTATGKELRRLRADGNETLGCLAFSPDGTVLAACGTHPTAGSVHLWDVAGGKRLKTIPTPAVNTIGLAFSPDGKTLAWAGAYGEARLYEVMTGAERGEISGPVVGPIAFARPLAFAPDGRALALGGTTVRLWDLAARKDLGTADGHRGAVWTLAFSPDGTRLLSGSTDTTGLVWSRSHFANAASTPAGEMDTRTLEALWADLGGTDGPRAYVALWRLALAPARAAPFLKERLRPAPAPDRQRLARLIADLDDDRFAVRENASREIARMGDAAQPALRAALAGKPSAELRQRLRRLLERGETSSSYRQALRAVEALEHMATPEARRLLESLAGGAPEARLTREAKAAAERCRLPPGP